jgi:hypothetical protein
MNDSYAHPAGCSGNNDVYHFFPLDLDLIQKALFSPWPEYRAACRSEE